MVGEVLLPAIGPQALDLSSGFPFRKALHLQDNRENFALFLDQAHPSVPSVIINQGYKVTASSNAHILCRSPYIRMDHIEQISTLITLVGEWKSVLLAELARSQNTKFRQPENNVLRLHFTKPREVNMDDPIVPLVNIQLNIFPFHKERGSDSLVLRMNILHFWCPCAMTLPSSLM